MPEKYKFLIPILLIGIIIGIPITIYQVNPPRIPYFSIKTLYSVDLTNSTEIIEKAENFDYFKYVSFQENSFEPKLRYDYFDGELIENLTKEIETSRETNNLDSEAIRTVNYAFFAQNVSFINISYDTSGIREISNETEIMYSTFSDKSGIYYGYWYINSSILLTPEGNITYQQMNNVVIVTINIEYTTRYTFQRFTQVLVLNDNLDVCLVSISDFTYYVE